MRNERFRVRFVKDLMDSSGHSHECIQGEFEIAAASIPEAAKLARERFAERHGVSHWSLHADYEIVDRLSGEADVSNCPTNSA